VGRNTCRSGEECCALEETRSVKSDSIVFICPCVCQGNASPRHVRACVTRRVQKQIFDISDIKMGLARNSTNEGRRVECADFWT
jgi:hypothetical protein